MRNLILFLTLLLIGCGVDDDSPQGGIPTIEFKESVEGTDTILLGTSVSYQMGNLILPALQRSYYIGNLVEIEFDKAELTLLDTNQTLSFIDSVFIELTDNSKTFVVANAKVDSTVGYKFEVPRFSYYPFQAISTMELSEKNPQIRFKFRNTTQTGLSLKVKMIFKLGRVTGYVA